MDSSLRATNKLDNQRLEANFRFRMHEAFSPIRILVVRNVKQKYRNPSNNFLVEFFFVVFLFLIGNYFKEELFENKGLFQGEII